MGSNFPGLTQKFSKEIDMKLKYLPVICLMPAGVLK